MRQLFSLEFPLVKSIFFALKKKTSWLIILLNGYWVAVLCYGSLNTRFKEFIWEIQQLGESCHSWIDITGRGKVKNTKEWTSPCVLKWSQYMLSSAGRIAIDPRIRMHWKSSRVRNYQHLWQITFALLIVIHL